MQKIILKHPDFCPSFLFIYLPILKIVLKDLAANIET